MLRLGNQREFVKVCLTEGSTVFRKSKSLRGFLVLATEAAAARYMYYLDTILFQVSNPFGHLTCIANKQAFVKIGFSNFRLDQHT